MLCLPCACGCQCGPVFGTIRFGEHVIVAYVLDDDVHDDDRSKAPPVVGAGPAGRNRQPRKLVTSATAVLEQWPHQFHVRTYVDVSVLLLEHWQ